MFSWPSFISNNHKSTQKKRCSEVWGQNQVILGWFASLANFCIKSHEILTKTLLSCIDAKQQQNDRNLCEEYLGAKLSHLGLVPNFSRFSCQT